MDSNDPDYDREKSSGESEVKEEYPSKKVVIPAMAAAYLVVLLFSLVCYRR